ncbi:MAG: hypothetical protein EU536_04205 [Promethearchaeota archaeon]|nr:MAG: hypothetical protein EU536_04205 [Candidatus Lokiarchaeota archaeon]
MISEGVDLTPSKELSPELYNCWVLEREEQQKEVDIPEKLDLDNPFSLLSLFGKMRKKDSTINFRPEIRFDNSDLRAQIFPNKRSRLELLIEGDRARVMEKGKTLISGKFPKRIEWLDQKLGGGLNATVGDLLPAMSAHVINVVINLSCINYNTGKACRFCNLFLLVMGIEPMTTLVAGFEERMSKGVLPMPVIFHPEPNSAYEGFRPPTAEWIVEASEKMADSFMKHFVKWLPAWIEHAKEWGKDAFNLEDYFSHGFNSLSHQTILFDEIKLRLDKLIDGRPFSALLEG